MPLPKTVGRPSEWMVADQVDNHGARLKSRAALNELQTCQCPGCTRRRTGISRYCSTHKERASSRGDPVCTRWPRRNELVIFKHAVDLYRQANPQFSESVALGLSELDRSHTPPPSFQLRYRDMHPKLPRVAKAKGLLANWVHRDGNAYSDCILHALAVIGWAEVFYDGLHENRLAFIRTAAGSLLGDIRGPSTAGATLRYATTGATKRHLGKAFVSHAETVYGKAFWSNAVTTQDGQSMTLLSYAKAALRVADLHP
ncbi:hypothetical protein [Pseudophaeobacter sp.]|uniref:hypothetical protein n=1 Tax=Pseudophaeobacter sp. TaxID=1971739 RepID=UPI003A973FF3